MKVFVSWSGEHSRQTALLLRKYLPCIIQNLDVFVSEHDIESGARWASRIAGELGASNFGSLCLTPDNVMSPWLVFEAGALTKHLDGKACGLLLAGLTAKDVAGPIGQFQHRAFKPDEFLKLIGDLNQLLQVPMTATQVELIHSKWWPDLETEYGRLARPSLAMNVGPRETAEVLDELVERIRGIERSLTERADRPGQVLFRTGWGPVPKSSAVTLVRELTGRLSAPEHELLRIVANGKIARDEEMVRRAIQGADPATLQQLTSRGFLRIDDAGVSSINKLLAYVLTALPPN